MAILTTATLTTAGPLRALDHIVLRAARRGEAARSRSYLPRARRAALRQQRVRRAVHRVHEGHRRSLQAWPARPLHTGTHTPTPHTHPHYAIRTLARPTKLLTSPFFIHPRSTILTLHGLLTYLPRPTSSRSRPTRTSSCLWAALSWPRVPRSMAGRSSRR